MGLRADNYSNGMKMLEAHIKRKELGLLCCCNACLKENLVPRTSNILNSESAYSLQIIMILSLIFTRASHTF